MGIQGAAAHTSTGLAKASVGGWDQAALVKHGRAQRCSCPWRRRNHLILVLLPGSPREQSPPALLPQQNPRQKQHPWPRRAPAACSSSQTPEVSGCLSGTNSLPPPLPPPLPSADELRRKMGILCPQAEGFISYMCVCSAALMEYRGHLLDVNPVLAVPCTTGLPARCCPHHLSPGGGTQRDAAPAGRGAVGRTQPGPGGQGEAARPRYHSSGPRCPRRDRLVPGRAPEGLGGDCGLCRAGPGPRPAPRIRPSDMQGAAAPPMPYARSGARGSRSRSASPLGL